MQRHKVMVLALLAASVGTETLAGQAQVKGAIGTYTGYVFRGVTLTNRPVFQPAMNLIFPVGKVEFNFGGWANVEAGRYNGPRDLSQAAGGASLDVTELDWTGEGVFSVGSASMAFGFIGYRFPNPAATSPVFNPSLNTFEVYSRLGLKAPLSPTVALYYDVSKIKGAYLEATLGRTVPVGRTAIQLGGLAGWSAGQDAQLDGQGVPGVAFYNFEANGLTHVDLNASVGMTIGGVGFTPSVHVVYGHDRFAKLTSVGKEQNVKLWLGGTMSWSRSLGRAASRAGESREVSEDR